MTPQARVTEHLNQMADTWAKDTHFNVKPSKSIFQAELVEWMQSNGLEFANPQALEQIWPLFLMRLENIRSLSSKAHLKKLTSNDPDLAKLLRPIGRKAK